MSTLTIEATARGTITRACARTLNRALGTTMSGSTLVADAQAHIHAQGHTPRIVDAATLTGADKARHTREVKRSRNAQAAQIERKATPACCDACVSFESRTRPMPHPHAA